MLPVNPKGGTIFGYESVTSIAMMIRIVPFMVERDGALPGKTEWLALRAFFVCAMQHAVTTCPTSAFAAVAVLKRCCNPPNT
ncbi:MAG: hypothetical protein HYX38_04430 [Rhodospirillales bacterium]|nr:hypothetical protein [Rhodospirillales bacterium]